MPKKAILRALRGTSKMFKSFKATKPKSRKNHPRPATAPARTISMSSERYCFHCGTSYSTQYVGCPTCRRMQLHRHPELAH